MGNGFSCPTGFTAAIGIQCAPVCPADKGLENRIVSNEARCIYSADPTQFFTLKLATMYMNETAQSPQQTLEWIQAKRPSLYPAYKAAKDDFDGKLGALLQVLDRKKQIADAFAALQTAEGARDTAPQSYQDARIRYYTLVKGDDWMATERRRVLNAEVLPTVVSYVQSINSISERQAQQTSTKTAVDAVKDKLISLKDDFRTTTTTLTKQVTELKNQIELEKRRSVVQTQQTSEWFINLILVIVSLVVIVMLARRVMARQAQSPSTYTSSTYRR
jgi:hypothetical protein